MRRLQLLVAVFFCCLLAGCAVPERLLKPKSVEGSNMLPPYQTETFKQNVHLFDAVDLRPQLENEQWLLAVDHLIVIWDQAGLGQSEKLAVDGRSVLIDSRELLRRFNSTLPLKDLPGLLLVTGSTSTSIPHFNGAERYAPLGFEKILDQGAETMSRGTDSLHATIVKATDAAIRLPGRSALVVITEWERMGTAEHNALDRYHQRMRHRAGHSVSLNRRSWSGKQDIGACVHLIGVGNSFSRERMLRVPNCTSANTFASLAQPRDMAIFVTKLLYSGPADEDGDGIPNYIDECPATPPERLVTSRGCLRFPTEIEVVSEVRRSLAEGTVSWKK